MIRSSKNNRENYPRKCFRTQEQETRVKFNPGLSANRPSNNWALRSANAKYQNFYFFSMKYIKKTYLLCATVFLVWNHRFVGFFGCYCLTPSYYEVSDRGQTLAVVIGVRAGGGGRGGLQPPPNFGQLRFFGQQEKIWAKPGFEDVSMFFYYYYYFEEINILYFNLTKILTWA